MRKNELWIDLDNWRGNKVLRESPKTNSNNTIPERMSQPTFISIEMNNAPDGPLADLLKHPPRIHDKEDQGKNPESKGDVPVYKCMIHLLSLLLF
jgi:hypothetical protein